MDKRFYRVIVFFKLDLPLVSELATFRVKGETESIMFVTDEAERVSC